MKIICALLFCAILIILANDENDDDDKPKDRKKLNATNELLQMHINKCTLWDRFKHFVRQNRHSMEQLNFMFAIPEQDYDGNTIKQHILERELQQGLLMESVTGNIEFEFVDDIGSDRKKVKKLGADRRKLLRRNLKSLITDIIQNPESHDVTFEHTCKLIGLYLSIRYADNYSTSAVVTPPPDNTCVISHGSTAMVSCKYVIRRKRLLRLVDNDNHLIIMNDILLSLLR
ncbi:uncharacterized protein LOC126835721 [Adelges cooleyi]|uniref:uncharacterized protein LOC126835721 n=1 Tax=Adelges cooleyi TaxID=133065 RepID=UPI00217F9433|nr:uncharacterized protein LOC126835721 [Adelges cooleyi]